MSIFQIADIFKKGINLIRDFLLSRNWPGIISVLKIIVVVISVVLFLGIVELIIKLNIVNRAKSGRKSFISPAHFPKRIAKKWTKIEERLKSGQEAELKLAVIEADKFFDDILKRCGYAGKDMGERLRKINASQISNLDDIWQAHKIRNNIVHDINYKLTVIDAEKAIKSFRNALEELEVL
jgi:energy-converting hydrogenase Eha subunit A